MSRTWMRGGHGPVPAGVLGSAGGMIRPGGGLMLPREDMFGSATLTLTREITARGRHNGFGEWA